MINTQDCWLYAGYKNKLGYGTISTYIDKKSGYQYAHRVSYETFVAPIPDGLVIDHLCSVRACINPEHLEPVTASVNTLRGEGVGVNTRKTHCPKGHEYTPDNTVSYSTKWRRCRQCISIKNRADYAKRISPYA
jgi:hypothetical protein